MKASNRRWVRAKKHLKRVPVIRQAHQVRVELGAIKGEIWSGGSEDRGGFGLPLNGQIARMRVVRGLLNSYEPDAIIETGTYLGTTTRFFSTNLIPVYSAEIKRLFYLYSRIALGRARNVKISRCDSVQLIRRLANEGLCKRPLVYLDAHWWGQLPLRSEVDEIYRSWDEAIIMIDDCRVPDDDGYGYDVVNGIPIDLDILDLPPDAAVAYPRTPSSQETGARRGTLYIARGQKALRSMKSLGDDLHLLNSPGE